LKDYLTVTDILEDSGLFDSQEQIIKTLLDDHETIIHVIRNHISPIADKYLDLGTTDFITGIMEQHEKTAWMLRAHLKD
jgi:starvation-inducible DNA-binding protein